MSKILKHSERIEKTDYYRVFELKSCPGAGYSFECDEAGNPLVQIHSESNIAKCLSGEYDVIDKGVEAYVSRYTQPAVLLCDCGEEFELVDTFYEECPSCGTGYNGAGQKLRPMNEWGEETGESLADIYNSDAWDDHPYAGLDW